MNFVFLSFFSGVSNRGVETYVHELGNQLIENNHTVTVFQKGPALANADYRTVQISGKLFTFKALLRLDSSLDALIPTNGRFQSILCRVWTWIYHKHLVISGHSGPGRDERINLYCFPDLFLATSTYMANWAKKVNPFVKIAIISDGVNLTNYNSQVKPMSLNLAKPIILCVAALESIKRQELAINAVARMPKGSLVLVGKGSQYQKLDKLAQDSLLGRYKILSLTPAQMPSVYKSADVFTYPTSAWEASGLVLFEALASGLPIVASDDPIRREIIGEAGLFIDPLDSQAYCLALELALKKKWGDIPRKQSKLFSWKNIARQYEVGIMNL